MMTKLSALKPTAIYAWMACVLSVVPAAPARAQTYQQLRLNMNGSTACQPSDELSSRDIYFANGYAENTGSVARMLTCDIPAWIDYSKALSTGGRGPGIQLQFFNNSSISQSFYCSAMSSQSIGGASSAHADQTVVLNAGAAGAIYYPSTTPELVVNSYEYFANVQCALPAGGRLSLLLVTMPVAQGF